MSAAEVRPGLAALWFDKSGNFAQLVCLDLDLIEQAPSALVPACVTGSDFAYQQLCAIWNNCARQEWAEAAFLELTDLSTNVLCQAQESCRSCHGLMQARVRLQSCLIEIAKVMRSIALQQRVHVSARTSVKITDGFNPYCCRKNLLSSNARL